MARMIAIKMIAGYRAARLEYDTDEVISTLEDNWNGHITVHVMIADGDMLSLSRGGPMRVSNRRIARAAMTLQELIALANKEGIHRLSIYDEGEGTLDEYADWNMTCESGDDLFIENIATAGPWHHIIDGAMVHQIFSKPKAA